MAFWYARAGITAVVVENPGTAELDETPNDPSRVNSGRDKLTAELIVMGRSYLGLSVFQKMHILGWLKTVPFVDPRRIALSGHSLGTEPAMVVAVLDQQIKALVFNDFLCNNQQRYVVTALPQDGAWRHTNPLWHIVPGFLASFDFPDLLAAVAPRPLLFTEGGVTLELERVRRAYETLGAGRAARSTTTPSTGTPPRGSTSASACPKGSRRKSTSSTPTWTCPTTRSRRTWPCRGSSGCSRGH